jgi:hypothetical protein
VSVLTGTILGIFAFAGGLGGLSTLQGDDLHQALQYRRDWRFYPTSLIPLEHYEYALGRKVYREDFDDFEAISNGPRVYYTDVVGMHPPKEIKDRQDQWWKDVLAKWRAEQREKEEARKK